MHMDQVDKLQWLEAELHKPQMAWTLRLDYIHMSNTRTWEHVLDTTHVALQFDGEMTGI